MSRASKWWVGASVAGLVGFAYGCGSDDDPGGSGGTGAAGGSGNAGTGPGGGAGASGSATGGAAGSSGSSGSGAGGTSGGAAGVGGAPPDPTAACAITPERIRITEVNVGTAVVNDENESALRPLVISAVPRGGSRLAFMGADRQVRVVALDNNDQLVGSPMALPANDFGDLYADDNGGVLLVARNAEGSGERHCGNISNLCGNSASYPTQQECWDMYMVRFDGGSETWATKLTESSATREPYLSSPTESSRLVYIWQTYAHHGRIAFDGTNYAGYYGAAISVSERCVNADSTLATGVNIHQGDRMTVVGPTGELLTGHNSFGWGCSHSGYERILWDPGANRFVTVCKTDNNNRIALAPRYSTIRPVDLAAANLGDLALATGGGYWLSTSDVEPAGGNRADVFLLRWSLSGDTATLNETVTVAATAGLNERAPHLAAYGTDGLLLAWETSSATGDLRRNDTSRRLQVQVRNRATGAAIGEPLAIEGVLGNRYQEFRAFPDGSVAFPAPGANNQSVKILRILPCSG